MLLAVSSTMQVTIYRDGSLGADEMVVVSTYSVRRYGLWRRIERNFARNRVL